jgi:hypothetical protein
MIIIIVLIIDGNDGVSRMVLGNVSDSAGGKPEVWDFCIGKPVKSIHEQLLLLGDHAPIQR